MDNVLNLNVFYPGRREEARTLENDGFARKIWVPELMFEGKKLWGLFI